MAQLREATSGRPWALPVRRQSGTLDLLEVGIVGPLEYHEAPGSTALFVSSGFERNLSWPNQKMCQKRATRIPFVHIWPIWHSRESVSYVFSPSDFVRISPGPPSRNHLTLK